MTQNILPLTHADLTDTLELLASLLNEANQRALVIVATAKLETLILDAVNKVVPNLNLGFNKNLQVLVGRGLLHPEVKVCLSAVWDLRCHFAHTPNDCSLDDQKSSKSLKALHDKLDADVSKFTSMLAGKLAEWQQQTPVELTFKGTPEMQFFSGVFMLMAFYLIGAKILCPSPLEPPTLENPTFQWGP
jgi:hypothetical protein